MEIWTPLTRMRQIFSHAFRQKNVPSVAAIHHPLRSVDPGACDIRSIIHISDLVHGATMDAHPQGDPAEISQRLADFHSTSYGRFRTGKKDQRHAISRWNSDHLTSSFRTTDLLCISYDVPQLLLDLTLLVEQQFGISDHVHEQDVADLQLDIPFRVRRHVCSRKQLSRSAPECRSYNLRIVANARHSIVRQGGV